MEYNTKLMENSQNIMNSKERCSNGMGTYAIAGFARDMQQTLALLINSSYLFILSYIEKQIL